MAISSSAAFTSNVATLLEVTGLTHRQFAKLCGLPAPRISEIVAGKYGHTFKTLDLVTQAFNLHFGEDVISSSALISENFEIPAKLFSHSA